VIDDAEVALYRIRKSVESAAEDLTFAIQNLHSDEAFARLNTAKAKINKTQSLQTVIDTLEGILEDKKEND
jgi:hypothetical protein